ncbi:GNAT family N-acetyltransferase [Dongshaea marina]|uniref:GNAT family N-acetyltransferase n=1 Tax=Dongshaea marina TaxID=2047966 RepID=UPI00131F1A1A|nr:GNAT family N-acetyltransferase [Dongshaea marina]
MDCEIRPCRIEEAKQLEEIEQRCFLLERIGLRQFRYLQRSQSATVLVAAQAEQILGYGVVLRRCNSKIARVYALAVDLPFQRMGVGQSLLNALEQQALSWGAHNIRLEVHQANYGAQKLYLDSGYLEFARLPYYYTDLCSAIRMEKSLIRGGSL